MELLIAVIQMNSVPGEWKMNIDTAGILVKQAVEKGTQLVVLPELFATGYVPNEKIRNFGEVETGRTLRWMKEKAQEYKVSLGGGIPVYEDGELYNRYYIISPEGNIEGYAQKDNGEAYCFKRGEGIYIVNSTLGRIGVGICADNHESRIIRKLQDFNPDFLLMPHAWPSSKEQDFELREFVRDINSFMGIPVVFINPVGQMDKMKGVMGKLMNKMGFELRGQSSILDRNGDVLIQCGKESCIAVAKIRTGTTGRPLKAVPEYSGNVRPGSSILRKIIIPLDIFLGKRFYRNHIRI